MAQKGAKYERQLREWFQDRDGAAIRIPASGARTTEELPDIFGKMNDDLWACELKYTSGDRARFTKEEAKKLLFFANQWDAQPLLVARYSYDKDFYGFKYNDMRAFNNWKDFKTVSFHREKKEYLEPLEDIIGRDKQTS